jgi:hypothetical protein
MVVLSTRKEISSRLRLSLRDNCINWRGAAIRSGDNVIFKAKSDGCCQPGQIIDIQDYRDIPRNEVQSVTLTPKDDRMRYILIRHRSFVNSKDCPSPDPVQYCHLPDDMKEDADTLELEWVEWNLVVSPCFIFHVDTVQRGSFTCKGMDRCFFIRYYKTRNKKYIPIAENSWHPFYRDKVFPDVESYPKFIWNNIQAMKTEAQRALCRGGQWDGRTVTAKFYAQPSFFCFLKDEVENAYGDAIPMQTITYNRSKKVVFNNLAATQRRIKFRGEFIRILCEDELDAVRKVLGVTFGVGITQTVPSFKQLKNNQSMSGTVWLKNSDAVRIVTCCHEGHDLDST